MSTRCNIILEDAKTRKRIYLYHHHDGYPEGVGADLARFVAKWNRHYYYRIEEYANALLKGIESEFYGRKDDEYELTSGLHGDIEYCYLIKMSEDAEAGKNTAVLEAYQVLWEDEIATYASSLCAIDSTIVQPIAL